MDFSRYGFDRAFLRDIPEMPGVYLFRDRGGRVIYVGKASNLKVRISSYFWDTGESVGKIEGILEKLSTIEYRVLGSDLEAMIEEYRLIDEYGPHFNTKVKIPERQVEVPDRILILPSSMQGMLKLYVLSDVLPLQELDYDCAGAGDGPIIDLLKKIQDSRKKAVGHGDNLPGDEVPRNEVPMAFDPLKVIALFYLRRYDESLNSIDIDRYRSPEEVVRALRMHCKNLDALFREKTTYIET